MFARMFASQAGETRINLSCAQKVDRAKELFAFRDPRVSM